MSYNWKNPTHALTAASLEERIEIARLTELHNLAMATEARAKLAAQKAHRATKRIQSPQSRAEFMAEAEAHRLLADKRWNEPDTLGQHRLEAAAAEAAKVSGRGVAYTGGGIAA